MYLIKPYNSEVHSKCGKTSESNLINKLKSTQIGHSFLVVLLSNFVALVFVSDNIYLKFSATYFQYIPLQLNASDSAELVVQMAVVYTLGRALTVFISIRLQPQIIIGYHLTILLISLFVLFIGQNCYSILWVGSVLMSFGFSAILPAIFAFVGQYIEVTNRMGTIIIFNCGSLNSFIPFILGSFIEVYPNVFLIVILINFMIALVLLTTIILLTNELEQSV